MSALFGSNTDGGFSVSATVGGTVVFLQVLWHDRSYRRLPRGGRKVVNAVVGSGQPSGDLTLDAIALDRLERVARGGGANWIVGPVLAALCLAAPIVAAVRVSPWWLLTLVTSAFVSVRVVRELRAEDPRTRLARLDTALS